MRDTFQVNRALDAVGLSPDAEESLRQQVAHLKDDFRFEMWENRDPKKSRAAALQAGHLDCQRAFNHGWSQAAQADPDRRLRSFPSATGDQRPRPLWGVVMNVSALDAIPANDPAALNALRFTQTTLHGGLRLNLGHSRGVRPYLRAEVALWRWRLGHTNRR